MSTADAPSRSGCPLGVSERTLSALHDAAISRAQADHLRAHLADCPACRGRLAALDNLATVLRSERPPIPDERLWQSIVTAGPSTVHSQRYVSGVDPSRPSWSSLGALAAALILLLGFVALFGLFLPSAPRRHTLTSTPTPSPTSTTAPPMPTATPPTLLPAHPLGWQQAPVPAPSRTIAFSGDGNTAYACSVGSDAEGHAALHIWRTADRGNHWIPARAVPNEPTVNGCELVADTSDPSVAALAWEPRGGGAGDSYTGLMTTVDGGVTWQAVPSQPFTRIDQLDSRGNAIYALRETIDSATGAVEDHLWSSRDRMGSWHQVDRGLPPTVTGFWLQSEGAGILIVAGDVASSSGATASRLWISPDAGATWQQRDVPAGLPPYTSARLVALGVSSNSSVARSLQGRFHICVSAGATTTSAQGRQQPSLVCSLDSGATWQSRTMPPLATAQGSSDTVSLIDITDDGALLASGLGSLYRLAAGSNRWQSLGPLPQVGVVYCSAPGAGVLWAAPAAVGASVDPQDRIFSVTYTP